MKIAVISDFHLGAKEGTPREDDSFEQAREAFERALNLGAHLILVLGDIFDSRIPKQEVWSKAMKILSLASERENQQIRLDDSIGKDKSKITALPLRGTPVVALHGNHERRGKGFVDSVEALESAGLIIRLHHNAVIFDTPDGKIAIHGMGYVPEEHAEDVLRKWDPNPVEGATNIFMIHQSLGKFTYSSERVSPLRPADLFEGFDFYLSGHVHYKAESKVFEKPLIFPGSTIRTQLLPIEAETPKGFYMIEIKDGEVDYKFIELESVRDFFYEKKSFEKASLGEVENWIKSKVEEWLQSPRKNQNKPPLARIRLVGTLAKGTSRSEVSTNRLETKFEDRILLSISREDLNSPELEEKVQFLKDIREEKISMEERGMRVLESNLEELDYDQRFDPEDLFASLSEGKVDEALNEVSEKVEKMSEDLLEEKE